MIPLTPKEVEELEKAYQDCMKGGDGGPNVMLFEGKVYIKRENGSVDVSNIPEELFEDEEKEDL